MMPASPEGSCPNCGKPFVDARPACECGHSYYPRAPLSPKLLGLGPMTLEEKRLARATAGRFLGILSIPIGLAGPYGLGVSVLALLLASSGMKSEQRGKARVGLICSCVGLVLGLITTIGFFYLLAVSPDARSAFD